MDIYIYTRESGEMGITWYNSSDVCIGMELWKNRSGQGGPNHTRCSLWSFGCIFGSRAHETYFSFWFLSCRETMMILLQKCGRTIWKLIWIEWDTRTEIGSPNMVPILWEILSTTDRFCQVCHHLKNQLGKPWFSSWTFFFKWNQISQCHKTSFQGWRMTYRKKGTQTTWKEIKEVPWAMDFWEKINGSHENGHPNLQNTLSFLAQPNQHIRYWIWLCVSQFFGSNGSQGKEVYPLSPSANRTRPKAGKGWHVTKETRWEKKIATEAPIFSWDAHVEMDISRYF